jgi:anti-repressor protein
MSAGSRSLSTFTFIAPGGGVEVQHTVRVIDRDGDPWFIHADACRVLEITNTGSALARLDDDEKADIRLMDARSGQHRSYAIISESGLYSLILRSDKPKAREFKKWVTGTVLPSIRRTGGYGTTDPMVALNDPAMMRTLLLTYCEKVLALEAENAALTLKAAALDRIETAEGNLVLTDAAKILKINRIHLITRMLSEHALYRRMGKGPLIAQQSWINAGLLAERLQAYTGQDGSDRVSPQVVVTPKGLARLAALLNRGSTKAAASPPPPA